MRAFRGVKNFTAKRNQSVQSEPVGEIADVDLGPVGDDEMLSDKQWNAIGRLLEGKSLQAAADETGINVRTLRRWMHTPEFAENYHFARRRQIDNNAASLQAASDAGIATLLRHLTCGDKHAEFRAAKALAQINEKSQNNELRNRLAQLGAILKQQAEHIQNLQAEIQSLLEHHAEPELPRSTEDTATTGPANRITKSQGSALPGLEPPLPDHTQQLEGIAQIRHQNPDKNGLQPVAS